MVVSVKPYVPDPKEPPTVPNVDSEKSPTANKQKTNAKMQPSPKLAASDPERVASETPPEANLEGTELFMYLEALSRRPDVTVAQMQAVCDTYEKDGQLGKRVNSNPMAGTWPEASKRTAEWVVSSSGRFSAK